MVGWASSSHRKQFNKNGGGGSGLWPGLKTTGSDCAWATQMSEVAGNKAKIQKPRACRAPRKLPNIIPAAPSPASTAQSANIAREWHSRQ